MLYHLSHQGSPYIGKDAYKCMLNVVHSSSSVSRVRLFVIPRTVVCQAPLSMGFSRQEYWSELPLPSPGDLTDPGIKPRSPVLQADSLLSSYREVLQMWFIFVTFFISNREKSTFEVIITEPTWTMHLILF